MQNHNFVINRFEVLPAGVADADSALYLTDSRSIRGVFD